MSSIDQFNFRLAVAVQGLEPGQTVTQPRPRPRPPNHTPPTQAGQHTLTDEPEKPDNFQRQRLIHKYSY